MSCPFKLKDVRDQYSPSFLKSVEEMSSPIFSNPSEPFFPESEQQIRNYDDDYIPESNFALADIS